MLVFTMTNRMLLLALAVVSVQAASTPGQVADDLLAADRAFAAAAAKTDVVSGLSAMFADDVVVPVPGGTFAEGRQKVIEALKGNADNAKSSAQWAPIRAGVSADGQHGFTFGFMTVKGPDVAEVPLKYLAYWVKQPAGWRVAVYKRARRAAGPVSQDLLPPALPARLVAPSADAAAVEQFRVSLGDAERAFSKDAQSIGLGAAFTRYGSADAVNMGGPDKPGFVHGNVDIGKNVGAGSPTDSSPLAWGPDKVIVASSGDLGVTIGMIRPNKPEAGKPAAFPFFTIWRRATASDPWRYVAE
jgi:ketosteroid isomerase-like protein